MWEEPDDGTEGANEASLRWVRPAALTLLLAVSPSPLLAQPHAGRVAASGVDAALVLAGHSGAYRVISFILLRGGLTENVREVYLFDALYGQVEKFAWWADHAPGRLVVIHTPKGGTRAQTLDFLDDLRAWGIPFAEVPESAVTAELLRKNRLVFIESLLPHDDVVAAQEQLRTYLETGTLGCR